MPFLETIHLKSKAMMKRILVAIALIGFILTISAQENRVAVSGGYAFTNIEDFSDNATGWRINGTYEFNPAAGKVSHGIAFGYIHTEVTSASIIDEKEYKLNSYPIYYAPKFELGNDVIKGFVKGAIGTHFSNYKRVGYLDDISGKTWGYMQVLL